MPRTVAVLVGSLRKDSNTRKLANALVAAAPSMLKFDFVEIGNLPMYNQDLDTDSPPAEWTAFRQKVKAADAVLFATPEFNRSMSGAMKNAVDVASRPWGKNVFEKKPGVIVSCSLGGGGGMAGAHSLRTSLAALNVSLLPAPEVYIHVTDATFGADGKLADERAKPFFGKVMESFAAWVEQILK